MPANTVYVGRPTVWGNPFIGVHAVECFRAWVEARDKPAFEVMDRYCRHVGAKSVVDLVDLYRYAAWTAEAIHARIGELRGRRLCCWCRLDKACHADVLIDLVANLDRLENQ